ncbi:uncharacterized protein J3D65DRAFT_415928 [Phyllosticta citribraziliensis]|uniref:Uncharacterized protein n=1 Tax=Phyllosticta citribraziliensis TaxID=989973 RepID=A0ABR1LMH9_9PEZI
MASAFVAPYTLPGGGGDPPRRPNNNNNNRNGHRVEKPGTKQTCNRCGQAMHGHWRECTRRCRRCKTNEHVGLPCSVKYPAPTPKNTGAVNEQVVKLSTDLYQETRDLRKQLEESRNRESNMGQQAEKMQRDFSVLQQDHIFLRQQYNEMAQRYQQQIQELQRQLRERNQKDGHQKG